MALGNLNVDTVTTSTAGGILGAGNASIMKNRIINGAMVIDQRNAGASVTITNTSTTTYTLDRWGVYGSAASKFSVQQDAGAVTPPAGFNDYLGITSLSAYSISSSDQFVLTQYIEGYNTADLDFGKSTAKTVTLSFWVRSSLTGTFGGSVANSAFNRSYAFTYTISSANTWEQKSITITGDTSGTWLVTNGIGLQVNFGLGVGSSLSGTAGAWAGATYVSATGATSVVGTSGATFYITGVQLEVGSSATGFEYRIYGTELANCQRYYQQMADFVWTNASTSNYNGCAFAYPVVMRASPTVTTYSTTTGASGKIRYGDGASDVDSRVLARIDMTYFGVSNVSTGGGSNMNAKLTISAEL